MNCKDCKFWKSYGSFGECHRKSPDRLSNTISVWPATKPSDWCGEFQSKEPYNPDVVEKRGETMSEWCHVDDYLPEPNQYVLAIYNGNNWIDEHDMQRCKCVVVKFKKGLSIKERNAMPQCDRKRTYFEEDEFGNNIKPYCWRTFGSLCLFGQEVIYWKPIILPNQEPYNPDIPEVKK